KAQFCFRFVSPNFFCPILPSQPESHLHSLPPNIKQNRPLHFPSFVPSIFLLVYCLSSRKIEEASSFSSRK
ncbi:hypothetical protein Gotur_000379, partial [Gossypium turneri]